MNGKPTYPTCNSSHRGPKNTLNGRCHSLLSRGAARRDLYGAATGPAESSTEGLPPKEGTLRSKIVSTRLELTH
jgi:hypothetical protein